MRCSSFRWTALALSGLPMACGDGSPQALAGPGPPAALAIVSGDGQQGKAGEALDEKLVVRVIDADGEGVGGALVTWDVTYGAGSFDPDLRLTCMDGLASNTFRPTVLGPSAVTARVATETGVEEATFVVEATALVISLREGGDFGWGDYEFYAPDGSSDAIVPVGTTVEWVNWAGGAAIITSTSAPPGGASFDSGPLSDGKRFQFVPQVTGTWEYVDKSSEATGTLTAEPRR